jgi:hypothetical protein
MWWVRICITSAGVNYTVYHGGRGALVHNNKPSMLLQGIRRGSIFAKVVAVFVFITMGSIYMKLVFLIFVKLKK